MHIAWCPQHRGVMRIAFFDPPPKHFYNPCPRQGCGKNLTHQIRNKYELETPKPIKNVTCTREAGICVCFRKKETKEPEATVETEDDCRDCCYCGGVVLWNGFDKFECCSPRCSSKLRPDIDPTKPAPAPKPICACCYIRGPKYGDLCSWCIDCPTEYCDMPRSTLA